MLLGILKYPVQYSKLVDKKLYKTSKAKSSPKYLFKSKSFHPPKCYHNSEKDIVNWILKPLSAEDKRLFLSVNKLKSKHTKAKYKSLDCWIMDVADEISYSIHDLEDAVSLGMITEKVWCEHFKSKNPFNNLKSGEFETFNQLTKNLFGKSHKRKEAIGSLVNLLIKNVEFDIQNDSFLEPILKYKIKLSDNIEALRVAIFELVKEKVILNANVQLLEFKGQKLVVELFDVFASDPERFLPASTKKQYKKTTDEKEKMRIICDFIAGMTDDYAARMHEKIFQPHKGSIFDVL